MLGRSLSLRVCSTEDLLDLFCRADVVLQPDMRFFGWLLDADTSVAVVQMSSRRTQPKTSQA